MSDFSLRRTVIGSVLIFILIGGILMNIKNSITSSFSNNNNEKKETLIKPDSVLLTGWYYLSDTTNNYKRKLENTEEFYYINPEPIVVPHDFETISMERNKNKPSIVIKLKPKGTEAWREATRQSIAKQLAFILDNKLLYTPTVQSSIDNGYFSITQTNFSEKELETIQGTIEIQME